MHGLLESTFDDRFCLGPARRQQPHVNKQCPKQGPNRHRPFHSPLSRLFIVPTLQRKRQAIEAVYEARAVPKDHKVPGEEKGAHFGM